MTNLERIAIAEKCIEIMVDDTGVDSIFDAATDLIANIGHWSQNQNLDFMAVLKTAIGHWHLEQTDEDSTDPLPAVLITIQGRLQ